MTIIKKTPDPYGGHPIESQSHRTENWMGPDYIEVPPELEADVWATGGWCDLTIKDGVLTGVTPTERPAPEPAGYSETQMLGQQLTDEELARIEMGQQITDLEIMILGGMSNV